MPDPSHIDTNHHAQGTTLVCNRIMTTDPNNYYQAEYNGRIIYFCTEFCLESFRADPERFYNAHSRRKDPRQPPPAE